MEKKPVYNYDPTTGEYTGENIANESPLEPGVYLIPAHSTEIAPPETSEHEAAVWNGTTWEVVEDWRGREGYVNGEPTTIKELGALADGWSDTSPEPSESDKLIIELGQIDDELRALDLKLIRPLSEGESDRVNEILAEKAALRTRRVEITTQLETLD